MMCQTLFLALPGQCECLAKTVRDDTKLCCRAGLIGVQVQTVDN